MKSKSPPPLEALSALILLRSEPCDYNNPRDRFATDWAVGGGVVRGPSRTGRDIRLFVDVATPARRARSAHAHRVNRLLGDPEREPSVPAHHSGCCSLRERLGPSLAEFLVVSGELRQLQRYLRQSRGRFCAASVLLHLSGGSPFWRRGELGAPPLYLRSQDTERRA